MAKRIYSLKVLLGLFFFTATAWAQPSHWITPSQWGSSPQPMGPERQHTPQRIVLHHAGVLWKEGDDPYKKILALQSWGQRDKSWPDVPYHYLIAPDGTIFLGRDLRYRPESNTSYDLNGVINVHLWGHFDEQTVSEPQLQATAEVLAWLRQHYQLDKVSAHCQEAPGQTTCPGRDFMRYFDSGQLMERVQRLLTP